MVLLSDVRRHRKFAVGSGEVRRTLADGLSRSVVVAEAAILTRIDLTGARRQGVRLAEAGARHVVAEPLVVVVGQARLALREVVRIAAALQEVVAAPAPLVGPIKLPLARLDADVAGRRTSAVDGQWGSGGWLPSTGGLEDGALLTGGGGGETVLEVIVPDLVAGTRLVVRVPIGALDEPMAALAPLVIPVLEIWHLAAVVDAEGPGADAGTARTLRFDDCNAYRQNSEQSQHGAEPLSCHLRTGSKP